MSFLSPRPALTALLVALALSAMPAAEQPREALVKAAFLHKFTLFVEWPAGAFAAEEAAFRIGVLGDDPFGGALDQVVAGETVHGRPLRIERARAASDLRGCHMVYVSPAETARLPDILTVFADRPVLLIGDAPGFAESGGAIRFYREGGRIRFEINPAAAERRGLHLSAQLLALARLVGPVGASR